jgi:hypothetical protein
VDDGGSFVGVDGLLRFCLFVGEYSQIRATGEWVVLKESNPFHTFSGGQGNHYGAQREQC